jgi:hypothetical protein
MQVSKLSDLGLVAYLLVKGYPLIKKVATANQKWMSFHFEKTPELEEDCLKYFDGKTSIDARSVIAQFVNLKALIRNLKEDKEVVSNE